jgi:hypothetical protein
VQASWTDFEENPQYVFNTVCPICMCNFEKEQVVKALGCGHATCINCWTEWMGSNTSRTHCLFNCPDTNINNACRYVYGFDELDYTFDEVVLEIYDNNADDTTLTLVTSFPCSHGKIVVHFIVSPSTLIGDLLSEINGEFGCQFLMSFKSKTFSEHLDSTVTDFGLQDGDRVATCVPMIGGVDSRRKRARVDTAVELQIDDKDSDLMKQIITDFGKSWSQTDWATALRSEGIGIDQLDEMRTALTTSRITPDQVGLRLFETFGAIKKLEAHSQRCQLILRVAKKRFIDSYKNMNKSEITRLLDEAKGSKSASSTDVPM